ncbi:efflux RND transporter periplasmic adaptor subunit [Chthonobacter albigriseus]|uniref:efflux RND transporter periplasmic adaptor subunit n=1 Tax=Chthonobacter albigriseus TaxID=1683161 RepID=UPI0015EF6CB8|nr:efflux RND transporter periplasmic adaptor subunit [Chthonobacter albigriseus]
MTSRPAVPNRLRKAALAAALALPLGLAACQGEEAAEVIPEPPAPVVQVATVHPVSLAESRNYTGTIQPRRLVAESFRVAGKLAERTVDVGDTVKAGDVIARLDPEDLDLSLQQAEASTSAARSNLARVAADERRAADLLAKGHVSQADYDGRRLDLDEAKARLETAEKQLELARNQRRYADLAASADGVVTAVSAEAGQVVGQGSPVVTLAAGGEKEILVAIPESRLGDLQASVPQVSLWADDASYRATLREVSPQADPVTRTYAARFSIPDADDAVRFGMTATLSLMKGDPRPVVRLPSTAVLDEGRGPMVFTVNRTSSTIAKTAVEVARFETGDVVVTGGLKPGDTIVTLGVNRLKDGAKVRLASAD